MTRRIWKADVDFYKEHADSVNDIERRLLLQLAVANALGGNVEEARRLLVDRSKVPGSSALRELVLEQLIRMPAGSWLLQLAKSLRS
jgi:hypothetical protein